MTWQELAEHGMVGCALRPCERRTECLLDGEPLCLDCADLAVDRLNAVGLNPLMRTLLPGLSDR